MAARTHPKKKSKYSEKGLDEDIVKRMDGLEAALKTLQKQVDHTANLVPNELKDRLKTLEEIIGLSRPDSDFQEQMGRNIRRLGGTKSRIPPDELWQRRFELTRLFDFHWPEIGEQIRKARTDDGLRRAFSPILLLRSKSRSVERLEENFEIICDLIINKEFLDTRPQIKQILKAFEIHKKPEVWKRLNQLPSRKLANALAGIPEYPCTTSFDILRRVPLPSDPPRILIEYYKRMYGISSPTFTGL